MVILHGDGWGVAGGRESAESCAVTWAGGPTMMRSTGRNTRPLNRPSTSSATRTRKKYLRMLENVTFSLASHIFVKFRVISQLIINQHPKSFLTRA